MGIHCENPDGSRFESDDETSKFVFIPKRMRLNFGDVRDVIGTSQIGLPYRIPDGCRFFGTICSFYTQ